MSRPLSVDEAARELTEAHERIAAAEAAGAAAALELERAEEDYNEVDAEMKQALAELGKLLVQLPGEDSLSRFMFDHAPAAGGAITGGIESDLDVQRRGNEKRLSRLQAQIVDAREHRDQVRRRHQEALRRLNAARREHNKHAGKTYSGAYYERQLEEAHEREAARLARRNSLTGRLAGAFGRSE
jgi:hypothetical protein